MHHQSTTLANFLRPQQLPTRFHSASLHSQRTVCCQVSTKEGEESSETSDEPSRDPFSGKESLDAQILGLAIPALGVEVIDPLLSVADTAFVGRLGVAELGGLGVAATVFTACASLFNFLANATGPLVAQAVARGDIKKAQGTTGQALVLAASLGKVKHEQD